VYIWVAQQWCYNNANIHKTTLPASPAYSLKNCNKVGVVFTCCKNFFLGVRRKINKVLNLFYIICNDSLSLLILHLLLSFFFIIPSLSLLAISYWSYSVLGDWPCVRPCVIVTFLSALYSSISILFFVHWIVFPITVSAVILHLTFAFVICLFWWRDILYYILKVYEHDTLQTAYENMTKFTTEVHLGTRTNW